MIMPWMRSISIEMTVRYMFCTGPAAGRDSAPEASAKRPFPPPACQPVWPAVLMRFCNLSHVICIIPGGSRFVNPGIFSFTAALQDLQFCLLHVIAYHLLATAEAPLSSACHCEERGGCLATWQSASPRKYLTSCLPFGRIRRWLRICLRHYFLQRCTARGTDCHVASLLAMTCNHLERVYVCKNAFLSNIPPAVTLLHAIVNQRIFNAEGVVKCLNKHENGRLQNLHFATGHLPFISLPIWYTAGTNR